MHRTPIQNYKYISDLELTPRASHETWEFSSLSPDSTPFSSTTSLNQALGCSTPPAEGMSMLYYNEDVDLATPEIGVEMGIRTPLLLPIPGDGVHPEWIAHGEHYSPQIVQPSSLRQSNHFDPPQNLAPCYLSDQPSNSTPPDNSTETPPVGEGHTETDVHFDSSINSQLPNRSTPQPLREFAEKYVYTSSTLCGGLSPCV